MDYVKNISKYLIYFVFALVSTVIGYGQCTVNAGGNAVTCGTEYTLKGAIDDSATNINWAVVSKPSGANDPVISGINTLVPKVTGMDKPGDYKFRLSAVCGEGKIISSEVVITSTGDVSIFSAGTDITTIPATVGTVNLNGVIPDGFTGEWRAENLYELRYGRVSDENSMFEDKNSSTTTFSLIKKANHSKDPAYRLTLKIISIYNSNCYYEKSIIVRFIPNPKIEIKSLISEQCGNKVGEENVYLIFSDNSPMLASNGEYVSAYPEFGTTVTLNSISVPVNGSINFLYLDEDRLYITINEIGEYKFTLTISNSTGEYTTPLITYKKSGISPKGVVFTDPNHPEQKEPYSHDTSGGEVKCNFVGQTIPITIYFEQNQNDDFKNLTNEFYVTVSPEGDGWTPNFVLNGQGQKKRSVTLNAPVGGWKVGTYAIMIISSDIGGCNSRSDYFIHISDGNRSSLDIENLVVCYPGSGIVDATIKLPEVYQGVIDSSYLVEYSGDYAFDLISKPEGAEEPIYESFSLRTLRHTSTIISNLSKPGEYVFKARVKSRLELRDWMLEQEFACSGASRETIFKITVSEQVGANAGSDQKDVYCRKKTVLVGNNPGDIATGKWTVESAPVGATPSFNDDSSPRVVVAGLDKTGSYKFKWTIVTGDCISSSIVEVITDQDNCKMPKIITNPMLPNKTKRR